VIGANDDMVDLPAIRCGGDDVALIVPVMLGGC